VGANGGAPFAVGDGGASKPYVTPANPNITVNPADGAPQPVQFTVHGADPSSVVWHVTNPAVGDVDSHGSFTPSGKAGGAFQIQVSVDGTVVASVAGSVTIAARQNGGDTSADAGAGGLEGVGGEGFGGPLPDGVVQILEGSPAADASLAWLYPYDGTVFPLGILPPLLQWSSGSHGNFDGVYVHLSAPPYYEYKGFFGRPARLASGADFVRHPIPKDAWDAATRTAAGGTLTVELVLAASGRAYGPIRESYPVALAPINGKIYYQAYNTALAHNYNDPTVSGDRMGGATLSIRVGEESPMLVAGTTTSDASGCRVCHTVSAYGDRMVVQHGDDYTRSSTYDLKNGNAETVLSPDGVFGWIGLYPDGKLGLGNSIDVGGPTQMNGTTGLYDMTTGAAVAATGLTDFATSIGVPAFSPDGKHASFVLFGGPSTPSVGTPDGRKLVVMDFDLATKSFTNPRLLWQAPASDQRPAWPTFFPTSDGMVFQRRWQGTSNETFATRSGAMGELLWVDLAGNVAPLARANGAGYLPKSANHQADERLNYEPSISPVASGGYAWLVFMSRRAYGNVTTMDPFQSDPRDYDLRANIATKKLWMAAIDLNPKPGQDPSHPAFYIPGQELHGVNSRPFFALEPCVSDRGTCSSGVDCCSGFCRDGYCVAPPQDQCSKIDERCKTNADCCADSPAQCIGGFCAVFVQ
jgi:hypothetical protein